MLPLPSWVDSTYEDAVDQLAKKAAVNAVLGIEKRADNGQGVLSSLGSYWQNLDPAARNAIMGAGAGGLLGAGRSAIDKDERPNWMSNMLTGGAIGAGIGGGGTLAMQGLQKGFGPTEAGKLPVNVGGKTVMLTPEQAKKIEQGLQPSAVETAAKGLGSTVSENPIMSGLAGLAGAEAIGSNVAREVAPGSGGLAGLVSRYTGYNPAGARFQSGLTSALEGVGQAPEDIPAFLRGRGRLEDQAHFLRRMMDASSGGAARMARQHLSPAQRAELLRRWSERSGGMGSRVAKSLGGRAALYGIPLMGLAAASNYFGGRGRQADTQELLNQIQSES